VGGGVGDHWKRLDVPHSVVIEGGRGKGVNALESGRDGLWIDPERGLAKSAGDQNIT